MGIVTNTHMREETQRLFDALAEQMRGSLTQLHHGMQALQESYDKDFAQALAVLSENTLKIIDGYALCQDIRQQSLPLEPVPLAALVCDAAHELSKTAKQYGCIVKLDVNGRHGPVLARKRELETAVLALGQSFLEAAQEEQLPEVTLSVYGSRHGVAAGVFSANGAISADIYNRCRRIRGRTKQSLPEFSSQNGVGIYLADTLLQKISLGLRSAKYHGQTGLAATFMPSKQLTIDLFPNNVSSPKPSFLPQTAQTASLRNCGYALARFAGLKQNRRLWPQKLIQEQA